LVKVELSGFRTHVREGITVQVAQTVRLDVILQVGEVSETIEVTADASLLKTETPELSTTVNNEQIARLPLDFSNNIRNPMAFLKLVPGAVVNSDSSWPVTSQNGLQSFTEEIRIDGAPSTNPTPGVFNEAQPSCAIPFRTIKCRSEVQWPGTLSVLSHRLAFRAYFQIA
jgi:hypothetical protein